MKFLQANGTHCWTACINIWHKHGFHSYLPQICPFCPFLSFCTYQSNCFRRRLCVILKKLNALIYIYLWVTVPPDIHSGGGKIGVYLARGERLRSAVRVMLSVATAFSAHFSTVQLISRSWKELFSLRVMRDSRRDLHKNYKDDNAPPWVFWLWRWHFEQAPTESADCPSWCILEQRSSRVPHQLDRLRNALSSRLIIDENTESPIYWKFIICSCKSITESCLRSKFR